MEQVMSFLTEMRKRKLAPTPITCTLAIELLAKEGNVEFAWQLYQDMKGRGIKPSLVTFICMLR
jgi:pentatricopeptide repeat protein